MVVLDMDCKSPRVCRLQYVGASENSMYVGIQHSPGNKLYSILIRFKLVIVIHVHLKAYPSVYSKAKLVIESSNAMQQQ